MMPNPTDYLEACDIVDFREPSVLRLSAKLAAANLHKTVQRCFEFVRDEILHSSDYELNPVTCVASDVLRHKTGFCYAKSHLLCALLRANGIPTGMCYQRLSINDDGAPFCLHGLNAVFLPEIGWYRIDARGNRSGISSEFRPPHEQLAFATDHAGEADLPGIHATPLPVIIDCLNSNATWHEVLENLPDSATVG